MTGIDLAEPDAVPGRSQALTYNVLDRPETLSEGGRTAAFTYDEAGDRVKMAVTQGSAGGSQALLTRYYIGGRYEVDVTPTGAIRQRLFLGGDAYSAPAALVKDSTQAWTLVAIGRDYLGSITHLADAASGTLLAEYSYDPWGRLRDPQTLAPYDAASQPELLLGDRGFTGHEHLTFFELVNMNARLYDPLAGRFLSPDPYIQAPDNTQNLNRYSYALNNPLKYTDESGEIIGTISGVLSDLFNNVFVRTFKGNKWDWTQTRLGWEIDKGLFHTDPNKSTPERVWEIVSRLTWQLPQTILGDLIVSGANAFGAINDVSHNYGITAVDMGLKRGAVTIGFYTAGPKGYKADWKDHLFVHEYGHYIQSQQHGPMYLFTVGLPSFQSAILHTDNPNSPKHNFRWFEADASYKGAAYFDKYYGSQKDGFVKGSPDYFDKASFTWQEDRKRSPYLNPRTGRINISQYYTSGKFHWTDIPIYIPIIGLFPYLFY